MEASKADSLFSLQINWEPAGRTARQVMDRLIDMRDTDAAKSLRSASDLADLMDRLKETP